MAKQNMQRARDESLDAPTWTLYVFSVIEMQGGNCISKQIGLPSYPYVPRHTYFILLPLATSITLGCSHHECHISTLSLWKGNIVTIALCGMSPTRCSTTSEDSSQSYLRCVGYSFSSPNTSNLFFYKLLLIHSTVLSLTYEALQDLTICILQYLDTTWVVKNQFSDPRLSNAFNLIAFDMRVCGKSRWAFLLLTRSMLINI
jgi:hypothetical protein